MSFELRTTEDGQEQVVETITHTHQTQKIWIPSQLESRIAEINAQIAELEERRTLLEAQVKKFTAKEVKI